MRISARQYAQTLFELTDGKSKSEIEKSVADFARFLQKNRKMKLAGKIIEQFDKIYNQKKGIVEAEITSLKKISDTELKNIKKYVAEKYHAKEVVLENQIDKKIKGGIVLRVGDEIMDSSVAGKLAELKKVLTS